MKSLFVLLLCSVLVSPAHAQSFKRNQLRYERVQTAVTEKEPLLKTLFAQKGLSYPPQQLFVRVFKREKILQVWVKSSTIDSFVLLKNYDICSSSGRPGPKRREGDGQVPEGFYAIDDFNPNSNFLLSLRVSYPNRSDRILGNKRNPGGAIYIHGSCVTIGCIPITDDGIKELYTLAMEAASAGQRQIPVSIFPGILNEEGWKTLRQEYAADTTLLAFWSNLKEGYDLFEKTHRPPNVEIRRDGQYRFR